MDTLGDRMKSYEGNSSVILTQKTPVIIRCDGKAFHTLTRGMKKPYDIRLMDCMGQASLLLTKNIQGCQIAYTQSDEISLLLTDYEKQTTQGWFDYKLQKMVSVAASIATAAFLIEYQRQFSERVDTLNEFAGLPLFDARAFNVPAEDVNNYFLWRQRDCVKNSIQLLARSLFSHKECHKKNTDDLKAMMLEKGVDWEKESHPFKYGTSVIRPRSICPETNEVIRDPWVLDLAVPKFWEDRDYINVLV